MTYCMINCHSACVDRQDCVCLSGSSSALYVLQVNNTRYTFFVFPIAILSSKGSAKLGAAVSNTHVGDVEKLGSWVIPNFMSGFTWNQWHILQWCITDFTHPCNFFCNSFHKFSNWHYLAKKIPLWVPKWSFFPYNLAGNVGTTAELKKLVPVNVDKCMPILGQQSRKLILRELTRLTPISVLAVGVGKFKGPLQSLIVF